MTTTTKKENNYRHEKKMFQANEYYEQPYVLHI